MVEDSSTVRYNTVSLVSNSPHFRGSLCDFLQGC